jgi:hypothetical protein
LVICTFSLTPVPAAPRQRVLQLRQLLLELGRQRGGRQRQQQLAILEGQDFAMLEHGRQALGAVLLQARHALDGRQQGGHAVVAAQEIGGAHAVGRLSEMLEELKRMRRTLSQAPKIVTTG